MINNIHVLERLIEKTPESFTIITFKAGMAGSLLTRIVMSHKEYAHDINDLLQTEYHDPVRYPDSTEGFFVQVPGWLSFKEQHLSCAHLNFYSPWDADESEPSYFRRYGEMISKGNRVVLRTHKIDMAVEKRYEKVKFIRIIGNSLNRGITEAIDFKTIEPVYRQNILNFEIGNLLNNDYEKFIEAYISLTSWLEVTPRVNSVRAFILLWLEKQQRFKKTLS